MDKKYAGIFIAEIQNISTILDNALNLGIDQAIHNTLAHSNKYPEEPDLVYGIFQKSIPMMDAGLDRIFSRYNIKSSVTGIYCHKSPKVKFGTKVKGKMPQCELGDILIVIDRIYKGKHSYNGLLLQTKIYRNMPITMQISDDQFTLYYSWPRFEYVHKPLKGESRQVTPRQPHFGAQIGIFEIAFPASTAQHKIWSTIASRTPIFRWLGNVLSLMLFDISGRIFAEKAIALLNDDWDRVMWDLLDATGNLALNLRRSGAIKVPRKSSLIQTSGQPFPPAILLKTADMDSQGWREIWDTDIDNSPPQEDDTMTDDDDEARGISSIIMQFDLGE